MAAPRTLPLALVFFLLMPPTVVAPSFAQTTVGTGSSVGTVSDPSGAVISGASITITNPATGQIITVATNSFGSFSSGALVPGNYRTLISAKGFRSTGTAVTVMVSSHGERQIADRK